MWCVVICLEMIYINVVESSMNFENKVKEESETMKNRKRDREREGKSNTVLLSRDWVKGSPCVFLANDQHHKYHEQAPGNKSRTWLLQDHVH